jgi:hypothetical protein
MGLFDFLFGRKPELPTQRQAVRQGSFGAGSLHLGGRPTLDANEQALERYRYMLRTAPPDTIEQAHAEAFERLTPEQRAYVLQALTSELPESERVAAAGADADPQRMARIATRAELRNPGMMERTLAAHPAQSQQVGGGMLGGIAGSLLMSFAAGFVGSMAANAFLSAMGDPFAGDLASLDDQPLADESFDSGLSDFDGGFEDFDLS